MNTRQGPGTSYALSKAGRIPVGTAVEILKREFREHPEIPTEALEIRGAVYDIMSGQVRWL